MKLPRVRRDPRPVRLVRAEGEPFDRETLKRLASLLRATHKVVRATIGSRRGLDTPETVKALIEELTAIPVPSPMTASKRMIEDLKAGRSVEDLGIAIARPAVTLVEYDLRVDEIGMFSLDTKLGDGLELVEAILEINPLPPPSVVVMMKVGRSFDSTREDILADL
jgi:hypothetical protein